MTTANLLIRVDRTGTLGYELCTADGGGPGEQFGTNVSAEDLRRYKDAAAVEWASARPTGHPGMRDVVQRFADLAIPRALELALARWATNAVATAPAGQDKLVPLLCVQCEDPDHHALPWETVPSTLGIRGPFVVRAPWSAGALTGVSPEPVAAPPSPPVSASPPPRLLLVGPGRGRGRQVEIGAREASELSARFANDRIQVATVNGPTPESLGLDLAQLLPAMLHVAPLAATVVDGSPSLLLSREQGDPCWLSAERLARMLPPGKCKLVMVNGGPDSVSLTGALSALAGVCAVGWLGSTSDELAADFAMYFYERLVEYETARSGSLLDVASVAGAVCAFLRHVSLERIVDGGALPVVWLPAPPVGAEVRLPMPASVAGSTGNMGAGARGPNRAKVTLELPRAINPAMLANRARVIDRLSISLQRAEASVRVRITCDTGAGQSTVCRTLSLGSGASPIETRDLQFPALHGVLRESGRRPVTFTVTVQCEERVLAEETGTTVCMGSREWLDSKETVAYLPFFVAPQCDSVLRIIGDALRVLRLHEGPDVDYSGYSKDKPESVHTQMKALFQAMQEEPYRLQYVPPPPDLVYLPASRAGQTVGVRAGQLVRTPDEVLKWGRGTCHDLSLLWAACAEQINLYPVVVLGMSHTFLGYWTADGAHRDFWEARSAPGATAVGGREEPFGSRWLITPEEMRDLVEHHKIELVETTFVTKSKSFEDARKTGEEQFYQALEEGLEAAVDIRASRRAILPLMS